MHMHPGGVGDRAGVRTAVRGIINVVQPRFVPASLNFLNLLRYLAYNVPTKTGFTIQSHRINVFVKMYMFS